MNNLHDNLKAITDFYSIGIKGSNLDSEIAQGKFHLKNKIVFSTIKWSLNILSIMVCAYIIYKIVV
jgi:hypothetical protein